MKTLKKLWFKFNFFRKVYSFSLIVVQVILIFGISNLSNAQTTLTAQSATGSATTTSSTFSTVTGASVTLNATDVNNILVVSSFQLSMAETSAATRDAGFRISDNADANNINSGEIHRSLVNAKSVDYGIGSVVHIFDVSSLTGSRTYVLQHNMSQKTLETNATIVAIALKGGTEHLKNDVQRVSSTVSMSGTWGTVTGSETATITSAVDGGFYIAASIESKATNAPATGEWKLQYQKNGGVWTDLSPAVQRSMSNTSDLGIINLVGSLPDWTSAGSYKFRIAHRETSGEVNTEAANIVAVSLGITAGKFPVFFETATGVSTTSTSMENAITATITPDMATDLFVHAQYAMSATAESNAPQYDIYVDNSIFDGNEQKRYLSGSSDFGSGASLGLTSSISASTTYNVSLRHASTSGVTLTTDDISLIGFGLTAESGPLPVELLYFDAQYDKDSKIIIKWATASETNNDYFNLYRSKDATNWTEIAKIKGAGNSNEVVYYEFIDNEASSHDTYYKLTQSDFDGKSEEFEIIYISCKFDYKNISLYPNPAKEIIYFQFNNENQIEKPLKISIYNSIGQLCYAQEFTTNKNENIHKIKLPANLKPGIYFLHSKLGEDYLYTGQISIIE